MAGEGGHGPQTSGDYISHHLQNLQVCKVETGEWVWNQCAGNPMTINVDSMFWSIFLGLIFCYSFWRVAKRPTPGPPSCIGTASGWPSPTAMSAPSVPGAASRLSA